MRSPFPGMDPWLEDPALWPDVHQALITYSRDALQSQLGGRYFARMGERVYIEMPDIDLYPDVFITGIQDAAGPQFELEVDRPEVLVLEPVLRREPCLEIRDAQTGGEVVTVIEVLSPSNKRPGEGRDLYLEKQKNVLHSRSNLVEIDLLRGGLPTVALSERKHEKSLYRVVVSRPDDRRMRELYALGLRTRLPRVGVPLVPPDPDVVLDLQAVLTEAYRKGAYAKTIDYSKPPDRALPPEDTDWAKGEIENWKAARDPGGS